MLDKIVPPCATTQVTLEALGSTSGGALAASTANALVVPGSVTLSDGTNTYTDNGAGVITGVASGSGTINYRTGAISITGGASAHAVTATYKYFTPSVVAPILMQNSIAPLAARFRNAGTAGAVLVLRSQDGVNFEQAYTGTPGAWNYVDLGLVQEQYIKVYSTQTGRFIASEVNPT